MTDARPIAVVSGSTGNIGAAAVGRLSAEGYAVVALGRDETALAKLADDHAGVTTVRVDLSE